MHRLQTLQEPTSQTFRGVLTVLGVALRGTQDLGLQFYSSKMGSSDSERGFAGCVLQGAWKAGSDPEPQSFPTGETGIQFQGLVSVG
jgi:hypothetical protein